MPEEVIQIDNQDAAVGDISQNTTDIVGPSEHQVEEQIEESEGPVSLDKLIGVNGIKAEDIKRLQAANFHTMESVAYT